jgi:hypothetical protein
MFGMENEEIKKAREDVVKSLEELGYNVVDSIIAETPEKAFNKPVYYLSQSILLLSKCDCVYFMNGWDKARGCKIEHAIAEAYNIRILKD